VVLSYQLYGPYTIVVLIDNVIVITVLYFYDHIVNDYLTRRDVLVIHLFKIKDGFKKT